jgi:transcription antitermination factor NusG
MMANKARLIDRERRCYAGLAATAANDGPQFAHALERQTTADLRRREHKGAIELPKPPGLCAGDKVRIVRGAFHGHLGLYEGMRPHERVNVLLQLLGGACRVTLAKSDIAALG